MVLRLPPTLDSDHIMLAIAVFEKMRLISTPIDFLILDRHMKNNRGTLNPNDDPDRLTPILKQRRRV